MFAGAGSVAGGAAAGAGLAGCDEEGFLFVFVGFSYGRLELGGQGAGDWVDVCSVDDVDGWPVLSGACGVGGEVGSEGGGGGVGCD